MQNTVQITFRGMDASEAVQARVREAVAKLEQVQPRLTGCHVVVEAKHRHHHQGQIFHVSIDLTAPGFELAVNRDAEKDHAHEDVYVAVRDAFDAARRKLVEHPQRR